jgi:hypothetical protein
LFADHAAEDVREKFEGSGEGPAEAEHV